MDKEGLYMTEKYIDRELASIPTIPDSEIETLEPVKNKSLDLERELLERERKKFEIEKSLARERIQLEREILKQDHNHFERMRRQYEKQRRLDEENFQEAKLEFEKYKELEKQKMQLETREILNNCMNFKEFLDDYQNTNSNE
jgi:hypothetical protein